MPFIPQARGLLARRPRPKKLCNIGKASSIASKAPTWKQYVEQNQFEEGYLKGPALSKFIDALKAQMREVLKEAGAKVVDNKIMNATQRLARYAVELSYREIPRKSSNAPRRASSIHSPFRLRIDQAMEPDSQ